MDHPRLYFAYGSNLLSTRLGARCLSARPIGPAKANDFTLEFSKPGQDGSGKATLVSSHGSVVEGALYDLAETDIPNLDQAEGKGYGYDRIDDFLVADDAGQEQRVMTYIASAPQQNLTPYRWYLALVIAGALEQKLSATHINDLRRVDYVQDTRDQCAHRDRAYKALTAAGHSDIQSLLTL